MKTLIPMLSLALVLVCSSCNEEENMFNSIQNTGVMIVEFTNINDPSILTSPKGRGHCITSEDISAKISTILSSNSEQLHSGLKSSTLPFGYISIYDLSGEQFLVFKLNKQLSDRIKTIIAEVNKGNGKEVDLFFTKFSSEDFTVLPRKHPLAMSFRIPLEEFEQAVRDYRENAR